MATLTEVIRKRRQAGQDLGESVGGSIREKLRERTDWRRMLPQGGLLTALFPSLKAFEAGKGRYGAKQRSDNILRYNAELISSSVLSLSSELGIIEKNTEISAKNSLALPIIARDMNVMRQNFSKVVKFFGGEPRRAADQYFLTKKERENQYEAAVKEKTKVEPKMQEEEETKKKGFLTTLIGFFSKIVSSITSAFSTLLTGTFGFVKSIFTSIADKFFGLLGGIFGGIFTLFSIAIGQIIKIITGLFSKIYAGWGIILRTVFASAVGLGALKVAVGGILISWGLWELAQQYRKNTTPAERELERAETELINLRQNDSGVELPGTMTVADAEKTRDEAKQKVEEEMKTVVGKSTAEKIIENYNSKDQEKQKEARELLQNTDLSIDQFKYYYEMNYGKNAKPKTLMTIPEVKQYFTYESMDEEKTKPLVITKPEETENLKRQFNVSQASLDVKDAFSVLSRTMAQDVSQQQMPQNVNSQDGQKQEKERIMPDVFDREFITKYIKSMNPIVLP